MDGVKETGGDVMVFSSMHVSGEQLKMLTGVAAILRFPVPEVESDHDGDSYSDPMDSGDEGQI